VILVHALLFILEWGILPFVVVTGVPFLFAEAIRHIGNRPLSLRRGKKLVNQTVAAAIRDMETTARNYRSRRGGMQW
jgi:hypothetical protein